MSKPYVIVYTKENGKQKFFMSDDLFEEEENVLHRENGPAIIYQGEKEIWMQKGYYHRFDGPCYNELTQEPR